LNKSNRVISLHYATTTNGSPETNYKPVLEGTEGIEERTFLNVYKLSESTTGMTL